MAVQPRRRHFHEPRHRSPHHLAGRGRPGQPPGAPRRRQDRPPGRRRLGPGPPGVEPRRRPAARARSRCPRPPTTSSTRSRFARDQRPAGRAAGHRPRRGGARRRSRATILLSTERMRGVAIDPGAAAPASRPARCGGTSPPAAAEHGLAALAGSSPDVGVVGYTLGGGVSWLGRKLRPGREQRAPRSSSSPPTAGCCASTREHEPDLFWALRGGGGSFGVVTALELELLPARARSTPAPVLARSSAPARSSPPGASGPDGVPDEVTSVGRLLQLPPMPEIPEPLRGRSFVVVEVAYLGDEAHGAELLRPLRALAPGARHDRDDPVAALSAAAHGPGAARCRAPATGCCSPTSGRGDRGARRAVAARAGSRCFRRDPPPRRRARPARPRAGALARLDAPFAFYAVGIAPTPELKHAVEETVERVQTALAEWDAGIEYLDFAEGRRAPERSLRRLGGAARRGEGRGSTRRT